MGKLGVVAAALVTTSVSLAVAAEPYVTARAAVVMDAASGEVLWERNAELPLPPASTTKVLTAILALESGRLDDRVTVTEQSAETAPSKIGLRPGERMALDDLLYAVLLNSANDAASAVAIGLAGSEAEFAARMNAKAHAIGARSCHFVNPHGLTADGHVASAHDLARIFRYGLQIPQFREILETPRVTVPVDSRRVHTIALRSHNRLLTGYPHRVIGKTGYTRPAGRCFVGATSENGREVVIALLGSTDLWGDATRMVAFAFDESPTPVVRMASAGRHHHRGPVVTEGDEDLGERFRRAGVHTATSHGSGTRVAVATKQPAGSESGSGRYTVRLGPYATHARAEAARARLAKRGYRGRVVGQAVMLGEFTSKQRADRLAQGLRLKGYDPTIVAAR